MTKKIFIGVAWPYVNGDLHVGHLAGYFIHCDVIARWHRLKGAQVLMVSGTDCHGTPITVEADKRDISPQDLIKEYTPRIHELIKTYEISYDLFTSTTTTNHYRVTQQFFLNLLKNGYIIKKTSKQYYSLGDKRFLPDRYVEGECPYCHAKDQRADQCEVCGRVLDFGELIKPKSKLTGRPVTLKPTEHYYLDLAKLAPLIQAYVNKKSKSWRSWVKKETVGWLKEGIKPRPITRDLDWGVPLPVKDIAKDMLVKDAESKRFYVWFDAVIGYVSAAIEWASRQKDSRSWRRFWFDENVYHYYFMGQDNLAFHTLFWPGQLIGQDQGYHLPDQPVVNKYLNLEGKKFSKSRQVIIDSLQVANEYGADVVRFYLLSILPEHKQANWQWRQFEDLVNADLVDSLGNFVQRSVVFYNRNLSAKIDGANRIIDDKVESQTRFAFEKVDKLLAKVELGRSFEAVFDYARFGNKYLNQTEPWLSLKTNPAKSQQAIFNSLYIVRNLAVLLSLFLPDTSRLLLAIFDKPELKPTVGVDKYQPVKLDLKLGRRLNDSHLPLFKKIKL